MRTLLLAAAIGFIPISLKAQDTLQLESTVLVTSVLADSLVIPWDMEWGPQGWIWFNDRSGKVYRLNPDSKELQHIYTETEVFQSDDNSGAHAFSLHPDFPLVPYVYMHYTFDIFTSKLVRYTYQLEENSLTSPLVLLDRIGANASHNGSRIVWDEAYHIYLSVGDAFAPFQAPQDVQSPNGKILRMDEFGRIPEDNPFPLSYTWSYGHRNPQGLCWGPDGLLYSSEHGEATDDEINLIERGKNYGWPYVEGYCDRVSEQASCDTLDVAEPIMIWSPTEAPCALAYYDHPAIPEWRGSLLQAFLKGKYLSQMPLAADGLSIKADTTGNPQEFKHFDQTYGRIREILVAPNGRLFIATSNQEPNGRFVVKPDDDKIIEIRNVDYTYEATVFEPTQGFSAYPNPTSGLVTITSTQGVQKLIYELTTVDGRVVASGESVSAISGLWQLDFTDIASGMHVLRYEVGNEQDARKLLIQNQP